MGNPQSIVASKLSIVDDDGKERITLAVESGSPVIRMNDQSGKERITLYLDERDDDSDAYVNLRDANGKVRIGLLVSGDGFYQLGVQTTDGIFKNFLQEVD